MPLIYPQPKTVMSAFYRGADKQLHQLDAHVSHNDPEGVRQAAIQHMQDTQEAFLEPVLVLVRGGKL